MNFLFFGGGGGGGDNEFCAGRFSMGVNGGRILALVDISVLGGEAGTRKCASFERGVETCCLDEQVG